ncbi:hypothetical protein CLAFUW4_02887 [Fulvia fulva]|uniref:Uncharacterized protein n=1 Tax=Passalora fulva TaxID=5499 RepID=A0A9Q8L963_PASFU|nr:uncharacterized protein CLAFUR5_02875 [Fulvia fulva]KAK4631728.1 hypothetical protein CLAFUR4_02880 [Fulvia fulva]KAK4633638.1 hypothetical protein CLAFUR0_02883 [Fulvia fulva]UJO13236.1 hypothetical protein CLAFUR5_02875 [Fulvia fulva]WPV10710.1 hypothetical protein CLAFUW4_02887 [Fulvia fulva]WPV26084.1 hypothetical protein CLAFUW7_02884 [Fulvia fulva]
MGVLVREDGHFRSWLAALLCCCAAVNEDEHPLEKKNISKPTTARNAIWNEQPTPLQPMGNHPTAVAISHKGIDTAFNENDRVRPIAERAPSIHTLDFGEASLVGKMSLHSRKKSSTTLLSRMSIGRPTDFRRMDYTEKQRRSLVPLQLAPVSLRDSMPEGLDTMAPHGDASLSLEALVETPTRSSYRASRGSPYLRCQQLSSAALSSTPTIAVSEEGPAIVESVTVPQLARPVLSTQSSSSSIRSLRRQALESRGSNTSALPRPSSEMIRLTRKRSSQKNSADSADLDKEILELNTIIEERRAEAGRSHSPANAHVSAVAPMMQIRARSTTLTDIGSAFSRPLISVSTTMESNDHPSHALAETISPVVPVKSRLSQPFMSMPDPAVVEEKPTRQIRRPSSRMTGWISSLLSSSGHNIKASNDAEEPFYSCGPPVRQRGVSEASQCTTVTELDSPVLTAASSPTLKGHSRSYTGDSRITPISPASTVDEKMEADLKTKSGEQWPVIMEHPNEVGLAL